MVLVIARGCLASIGSGPPQRPPPPGPSPRPRPRRQPLSPVATHYSSARLPGAAGEQQAPCLAAAAPAASASASGQTHRQLRGQQPAPAGSSQAGRNRESGGARSSTQHPAAPAAAAAAAAAFACVSADVFMPGGAHLLPALDQAVHAAVVAGTTPEWRATTADIDISDAAITAGMAGWAVTSAYLLAAAPKRHALPLTLAWAFYLWGFGAVLTDPALVHSLKAAFHRLRPSTLHHSFSFPSGHTTAASFIVGALVMVLLPLALQQAAQQQEAQQQAAQQQAAQQQAAQQQPPQAPGGAQVGGVGGAASALARRCLPGWYGAAGGMWAAGVVATASGRVLADAHWVSDTLAGACLGAAGVAALSWLVSLATEPVLQERTAPTPAAEEAELKL